MTQRVFVTGGAGLLGRAILPVLVAAGYDVHASSRGQTPDIDGVTWHRVDLLDMGLCQEIMAKQHPDQLIALGWHMAPGNATATENFDWIEPSLALVRSFADSGGARVLFCGSCAEYDWSAAAPFSELYSPLLPSSAYGKAKLALFQGFTTLCDKSGLSGVWVRPFFMYGPGEARHRLVADVTASLLLGHKVACSAGTQKRDFLHVSDVASAMVQLLHSQVEGPVNIGSGQAIALKQLIDEISVQTGQGALVKFGARATPPSDPDIIEADIGRLKEFTAWVPEFDLESGVADTIKWWRKELIEDEGNKRNAR